VTGSAAQATFTLRHVEGMLGLGRGVIAGLIDAGFVSPSRGRRNEYRFTFQDVVLLRTAFELKSANVPSRRLLRSLQRLKSKLPDELPLSGLRIRAIGNDIAVRTADAQWEADSGQLLMDFEIAAPAGTISFLQKVSRTVVSPDVAPRSAVDWFAEGERLEAADPAAAEAAYRQALAAIPARIDAALNLGVMLCDAGRCTEAIDLYDRALLLSPASAALHFNRAIALEDQGRHREAVAGYERCLQLDARFHDAHFNAARLYENLGELRSAVRHYSAYRRLQQQDQPH
jgi:tetratricopeptide (TPR) repeat protein